MKQLVIIGASGFGKEVLWLVDRINKVEKTWDVVAFTSKEGNDTVHNVPVITDEEALSRYKDAYYICAVGFSKERQRIVNKYPKDTKWATLIDPSVVMPEFVSIGEGSIICAGSIISVDVNIGKHNVIYFDCTVGHDSVLNDFVTMYSSVNISGNCAFKQNVEIGTGSQIIQGKTIGESTIIGAGAVVIDDLPANCTVVGVPAKSIKFNL